MVVGRPPASAGTRRWAYRLVEVRDDGARVSETFHAPDDAEAIARAQDVIEGSEAELWRGAKLVFRWKAAGDGGPAAPAPTLSGPSTSGG